MPNIQEQIENLRKRISSMQAVYDVIPDAAEKIAAAEKELAALIIQTDGGAFVAGDVTTQGGDFIGRDKILATLADRSVIIGGNAQGVIVVTGDGVQMVLPPDQIPPDVLLKAYYRSLGLECRRLPLGVVDPNFADPLAQDGVSLGDVYTDLHVVSPLNAVEDNKDMHAFGLHLARGKEGERTQLLDAIAEPQARLLTLVGDPGSGKTTSTNYLTFLLADAETSARPAALPESFQKLLPVRLILRQAAKHLPIGNARGTAGMLWNAILAEIAERIGQAAANQLLPYLQMRLLSQGGLFLLDGLDEVPDADQRRKCLLEAVNDLARNLHPTSRVLLTARPYAYADPKWRLPNFQLLALAPFDEAQAQRFIERWYQAVRPVMGWDLATAQERGARLAGGIQQKPYLADLASRPLLLTLMATLDSSWGKLPEDRADLFEESVKLLLSRWQRSREVRNAKDEADWEPGISKALGLGELMRAALEKLAYQTHLHQASEASRDGDTADISRGEVLDVFCAMLPEDFNADILIKYLETRSGLLMGRRENVYAFPHRSFQEYLAACHLATVEQDFALKLRELVYSDLSWWREVFLLGVGKKRLGGLGGAVSLVSALVPAEVDFTAEPISETDWLAAVLAGQALLEMRLNERAPAEKSFAAVNDRVRRWLLRIIENGLLTPAQRLEAGDTLGALGDPRFDAKRLHLPAFLRGKPEPMLGFVEIPAGPFTMGSADNDKDAYSNEKPAHTVNLPTFYMARYPITNAQYRHFVEDDGYQKEQYWTVEGRQWLAGTNIDLSGVKNNELRQNYQIFLDARPLEKRQCPDWWNDPQWGAPTRPVVGICWYESLAYCRWLDEQLRLIQPVFFEKGYGLRLPSEAEWEKAAHDVQGNKWVWGNDWQSDHANVDETNLKETNPIGMFPKGATPTQLFDISGNVWEWTHSRWGEDLYKRTYGYPYQAADGREDESGLSARIFRGGSWGNNLTHARWVDRNWGIPISYHKSVGFRCVVGEKR